jgi:hypothetical protein
MRLIRTRSFTTAPLGIRVKLDNNPAVVVNVDVDVGHRPVLMLHPRIRTLGIPPLIFSTMSGPAM